jgi:hypothetical protein
MGAGSKENQKDKTVTNPPALWKPETQALGHLVVADSVFEGVFITRSLDTVKKSLCYTGKEKQFGKMALWGYCIF